MPNIKYLSTICLLALTLLTGSAFAQQIGTDNTGPTELSVTDLKLGTGTEAVERKRAVIHYTGWLYSADKPEHKGEKFDSSIDRGEPFKFKIGMSEVVAGLEQGVTGMKIGGKRKIIIPSDLAYGSRTKPGIPPYSALVFEVELLEVR